ncbi:hypothetical protein EJB05_47076, partial [Eragrostis curvula]
MRRHSSPAPVPLPDDDDLLEEFLLRLPPRPSSLPRASLVCKRWRRLLTDPQFLRRFSAFHCHQEPPLLGFFVDDVSCPKFTPTLDSPDRIPPSRFSPPLPRDERWHFIGCRHGLGLLVSWTRLEIAVWEPVTGDRRRVALPPDLFGDDNTKIVRNGALLCDDGYSGCRRTKPFKVVLLRTDDWLDQNQQAFASLYDSKTGVWSDLVSTSIKGLLSLMQPGILVGNSFYWLLDDREEGGILVFDLNSQSLATIMYPAAPCVTKRSVFQILRMEDGGLGLAVSSIGIIQLWERKTSSVGIVAWRLQKTIDLDKLLLLKSPMESSFSVILGYDEDGHVMFIMTDDGIFMVQLKSMKFRKIFNRSNFMIITAYHPYRSFYAIDSLKSPIPR